MLNQLVNEVASFRFNRLLNFLSANLSIRDPVAGNNCPSAKSSSPLIPAVSAISTYWHNRC